jgi:hypothetical protein
MATVDIDMNALNSNVWFTVVCRVAFFFSHIETFYLQNGGYVISRDLN